MRPTVTRAGPDRQINLSRLEARAKRRAWAHIRAEHPALAALLQDATVQALAAAFDAELTVEPDTLTGIDLTNTSL